MIYDPIHEGSESLSKRPTGRFAVDIGDQTQNLPTGSQTQNTATWMIMEALYQNQDQNQN